MSLNKITNKMQLYLADTYRTLKNQGAKLPERKNISNLSACIKTVIAEGPTAVAPEGETLLGIIVDSVPNKIAYNEGEKLDIEGLVVLAKYSNEIYVDVTKNCVLQVNDKLTIYDKEVKVFYRGFETYFSIHVYGAAMPIPQGTVYLHHFNGNMNNEISDSPNATVNTNYFNYTDDGKFNKGILVGGNRNYIPYQIPKDTGIIPTSVELKSGAAITVEFWMKPTWGSDNTEYEVFYFGNTGTSGLALFFTGQNQFKLMQGSSNTAYYIMTNAGSAYLNKWNHVAVVCKDAICKLFINGEKIGEMTLTKISSSYDMFSAFGMGGYYDELLISREALYEDDFIPPTGHYGPKKTLDKIYIEQEPIKKIYKSGEYFDLTGAIIKAAFTDGIIEDITDQCEVLETAPVVPGDNFRTIIYTYDGVTKKAFLTIGSFAEEEDLEIPQEALERILSVNYLESSGTQYIDTEVIVDATDMTVEIEGMFLNSEGYYIAGAYDGSHYYGLRPDPTNTNLLAWHPGVSAVNGIVYDYLNKKLKYKFENGNLYINDELVQEGEGAALTKTLTLFARNGKSAVDAFATCRVYSCKITKAGELVRNMHPCRYEKTGQLGFYDILNNKFYPNKGTGSFVWG